MKRDVAGLRDNYEREEGLLRVHLDKDPIVMFQSWLNEAIDSNVPQPNAFTLATVNKDGNPTSRVILLKSVEDGQFVFFTNYNSDKGNEITLNPMVCLNFLWLPLARQVRIEGRATKISYAESEAYFHTRPFGSQIGGITSNQSKIVTSREELDKRFDENFEKYKNLDKAPMPEHWGGYRVEPNLIEFWQGRISRLHDRFRYVKNEKGWRIDRLEP